jgi:proline dehydrogenase
MKVQKIDFSDTKIAFSGKSDAELKKTAWLFSMMNQPLLVNWGSKLAMKAVEWNLPFARRIVKQTIFKQFCGGTTLLDSLGTIEHLAQFKIHSILDYGVEAKSSEIDFNMTMNEAIRAIDFAARSNARIPFISIKISGLARFELLEKMQSGENWTESEQKEYFNASKRADAICHAARDRGVNVLIDAEESWIQETIDKMANILMERYNKDKPVVFNTFQMYRHDRLKFLQNSFEEAQQKKYILGAKLVRGAYMEKERQRADDLGYASPIHPDKAATDKMFNDGLRFCLKNGQKMAFMNASHNAESNLLQAERMEQLKIPKNHPHFWFAQLQGMSDNITFHLGSTGYNVAKYIVYGSVQDVTPYLIRRAQENTAVTGDMSREYALIKKELQRRGLQ